MSKKTLFLGIAGLLLTIAGFSQAAHAIEAQATESCTPSSDDFAAIQAVQDDTTLAPSEALAKELGLRKQLLSKTIACAKRDATDLQAVLEKTSIDEGGEIQAKLSDKLEDAINFYDIQSAKLDTAGIRGTQSIAKEMQAWRTANYLPLEEQIGNFLLWTNNQSLFQTAQNRLTQTSRIVSFIENAAPGTGAQASLTTARNALADAQEKNLAAKNALTQLQSPDQSFSLIQQSLQSLADAYKIFSDLNQLIQKLLPTGTK